MKKRNFLILSFLFVVISCSNNQNSLITYVEEETLKINIKEKGENIIWTKELEGDVLTENIKKKSTVLNNTLSPTLMSVMSNQYDSIYPYFENFGNLDTRNLNVDVKTFLNSFCEAISENVYTINNSFINKNFNFTYVFFVDDLSKGWKIWFKKDFPVSKPIKDDIRKKNNEEEPENIEKKGANKRKIFTSWIFGEPFNGDDYIQVPIRLFTQNGSVDIVVCMTNNSPLEIFNIEIKNWEGSNGK